jgi:hypothetical protein
MTPPLLSEEDLQDWTGFKQRGALLEWLRRHGIPYLLGRGGRICVTADAVNLPLVKQREHNAATADDIQFA